MDDLLAIAFGIIIIIAIFSFVTAISIIISIAVYAIIIFIIEIISMIKYRWNKLKKENNND